MKKSQPDVITEEMEEATEAMDQDQNKCVSNSETTVNVLTKTVDSILVAKLTVIVHQKLLMENAIYAILLVIRLKTAKVNQKDVKNLSTKTLL